MKIVLFKNDKKSFSTNALVFKLKALIKLSNFRTFEQYAIMIVSTMHTTRGEISQMFVVEEYGNTTPLYIAGNYNLMDFMEQTACQAKLTDIWNGNMAWNTSLVMV